MIRNLNQPSVRCQHGATVMELLVATLIFSIMMAIGASIFQSAVTDSQTKQCRANMMAIANVDQEHKVKDPNHNYTTSTTVLASEVPTVPKCPGGGTYTITISTGISTAQSGAVVPSGKIVVSCSAAGHGVFAPDIDTN